MPTLNPQQEQAVTAPDGAVLVLAGAGSGKTRVLIERLVYLVEERGIDPRQLLALTFTNKAAAEMKQRFRDRTGEEGPGPWIGTFHSFGLYVLRRAMDRLGRKTSFTVFDDGDQLSLMKRLVKELPGQYAKVSPRDALSWISKIKQSAGAPNPKAGTDDPAEATYRHLWEQYHAALKRAEAVDFDDLLVLTVELLEQHEEVRNQYHRRYRHILVDEYQDTNHAQYRIARALAGPEGNLFVVGDEDQSIYSWRGADINNILDFTQDFQDAHSFKLEYNYRSTKPILDAANALVANNENRLGKTLRAMTEEGPEVRFELLETGEDEAYFVRDDILKNKHGWGEVAVFFRTNAQSRAFEEAFAGMVNHVVVGGVKFFQRKEIKDIVAYLRLLVNPADDESLRRIINVPARGIGGTTLRTLEEYASARNTPLFEVLREVEMDETLSARARRAIAAFVELIDKLALASRQGGVEPLVSQLLEETGYRQFIEESDAKDYRDRLGNVDEFLTTCARHDEEENEEGLLAFLQSLALVSDVDQWDETAPAVSLMTIHSAKGLEFDYCYIVGLEEGMLPFGGEDFGSDVEEERRLCYVAMTRARKGLVMTAAQRRMVFGRTDDGRRVSRFVHEAGLQKKRQRETVARPDAGAADTNAVKTGTEVRHAKFGPGVVMFTSGKGAKLKARIRFRTGRMVTVMVAHAPLEILEGKRT
jgi:DNA helicase-2/ATP-dependent DNA helicase PcrA